MVVIDDKLKTIGIMTSQKIRALIATVENTENKVGLESLKEIQKEVEALEKHKQETKGLWVTDRPDLIHDPKGVMFRI